MKQFNSDGYYYVNNRSEMPDLPHYAIMEFGSITIPGDERSRTNPGHGYPESTESTRSYKVFSDKTFWEKYIAELAAPKFGRDEKNWVAMFVTPAKVKINVTTSVSV